MQSREPSDCRGGTLLFRGFWYTRPMRIIIFSAVSLTIWLCLSGPGAAQPGNPAILTDPAVSLPDVVWGSPLKGGSIHTLFVIPREALADVERLTAQLDLRPEVVALEDAGALTSEEGGALLKALDDRPDVIVIGRVGLRSIPQAALDALVREVVRGAGFVLINYDREGLAAVDVFDGLDPAETPDYLLQGVAAELTPEWRDGLYFVQTAALAEGRVVSLDFGPPAPIHHFVLPSLANPLLAERQYAENYFSLAARAIRWAARRVPEAHIASVTAGRQDLSQPDTDPTITPHFSPLQTGAINYVQIELAAPAPATYTVETRLRQPGRDWSLIRYDYEKTLAKGAASYALPPIYLGAGDYFLDIWLKDSNDVVDWFTLGIPSTAWPEIRTIDLSSELVRPNDTLDVRVHVPPNPDVAQPFTVFARATDSFNRRVAQNVAAGPASGGDVVVSLPLRDLIAPWLRIDVYAMDGAQPGQVDLGIYRTAHGTARVPVRLPAPSRQFRIVVAVDAVEEYNARARMDRLAASGVKYVYVDGSEAAARYVAEAQLTPVFEVARCRPEVMLNEVVRVPCLTDMTYREEFRSRIAQTLPVIDSPNPPLLSFGLGSALSLGNENTCQSASTLAAWRGAMQVLYGDITTLNEGWKTSFSDWAFVEPAPEEALRGLGIHAPWLDFRLFMSGVFSEFQGFARSAALDVAPNARAGFVATRGNAIYQGYDWWQLGSQLDLLVAPPDEITLERIRSYRKDGAFLGVTLAGEDIPSSTDAAAWHVWHALLHGCDSLWWLDGLNTFGRDGVPLEPFAAVLAQQERVADGLGSLLLNARRAAPAIAVYDSLASAYLHYLDPENTGPDTMEALLRIVQSLGYPYELVAPDELLAGLDGYRVLVLPAACALSDAEIAAMDAFAKNGGLLLADVFPGAFDEHGIARDGQALGARFEPGGGHVLLNRPFSGASPDEIRDTLSVLEDVFHDTDLPQAIPFRKPGEFDGEAAAYTYGAGDIVFLLNPPGAKGTESVGLRFDGGGTVYNPLDGRAFGGSKVTARMKAGEAALFCRLPYTATSLQLEVSEEALPGQRITYVAAIEARKATPGKHLVHVTLTSPSGRLLRPYSQDVVCEKGVGSGYIPLALDASSGTYRLRARDALTGLAAESFVVVP